MFSRKGKTLLNIEATTLTKTYINSINNTGAVNQFVTLPLVSDTQFNFEPYPKKNYDEIYHTTKKKMDLLFAIDMLLILEPLHELASIRLKIKQDCFFALISI